MGYKCDRKWRSDLSRRYNLNPRVYEAIKKGQDGRCAICMEQTEKLVLDHCHSKGRLRGFLCVPCNTLLGCAKDDEEVLQSAVKYLQES